MSLASLYRPQFSSYDGSCPFGLVVEKFTVIADDWGYGLVGLVRDKETLEPLNKALVGIVYRKYQIVLSSIHRHL